MSVSRSAVQVSKWGSDLRGTWSPGSWQPGAAQAAGAARAQEAESAVAVLRLKLNAPPAAHLAPIGAAETACGLPAVFATGILTASPDGATCQECRETGRDIRPAGLHPEFIHGTRAGWEGRGCKCSLCSEARHEDLLFEAEVAL